MAKKPINLTVEIDGAEILGAMRLDEVITEWLVQQGYTEVGDGKVTVTFGTGETIVVLDNKSPHLRRIVTPEEMENLVITASSSAGGGCENAYREFLARIGEQDEQDEKDEQEDYVGDIFLEEDLRDSLRYEIIVER